MTQATAVTVIIRGHVSAKLLPLSWNSNRSELNSFLTIMQWATLYYDVLLGSIRRFHGIAIMSLSSRTTP